MRISVLLPGFVEDYISRKAVDAACKYTIREESLLKLDFSPSDSIVSLNDLTPATAKNLYVKACEDGSDYFLVFCDDAYALFVEGLRNGNICESAQTPIVPVLVGSDFSCKEEHDRYKFWHSIDSELIFLFNYLVESNYRGKKCLLCCYNSEYARSVLRRIDQVLIEESRMFDKDAVLIWDESGNLKNELSEEVKFEDRFVANAIDTVFLIGHGDETHKKMFELIFNSDFNGTIFANSAVAGLLKEGKIKLPTNGRCEVCYVDVKHKDWNGSLQEKIVNLLFRLIIGAYEEDRNVKIQEYARQLRTVFDPNLGVVTFGDDGEIEFPLVLKRQLGGTWTPKSIASERMSAYRMAAFQQKMDDLFFVSTNNIKPKDAIEGITHFFANLSLELTGSNGRMSCWVSSENDIGHLHSTDEVPYELCESIYDFARSFAFANTTHEILSVPIQVNLKCDDILNNGAARLLIGKGDDRYISPAMLRIRHSIKSLFKDSAINFYAQFRKAGVLVSEKLCIDNRGKEAFCKLLELCKQRFLYIFFSGMSSIRLSIVGIVSDVRFDFTNLRALKNQADRVLMFYNGHQLTQAILIKSIKSAIGSIMSRNGSHNIGSHVLAALSHNVGTMPDDRVLYQYIQHRMDYIATATTDFPTWSSEEKLVNGLMRRFLSQRHLLDHIASSEGLHAFKFQDPNVSEDAEQPNTIRLRIRKLDEKGPPREFIKYPRVDATANFDEDVAVAIPGGVIGGHAFFTIIENVIRNAAKHGWAKISDEQKKCLENGQEDHLDVFVDFKRSDSNRTIEVDVYDGLSDVFAVSKNKIVPSNDRQLTPEEDATNIAIERLEEIINAQKKKLQRSLTADEEDALTNYLDGKSDIVPELYKAQYESLKELWGSKIGEYYVHELLGDVLIGTSSKKDELGRRLWLPLHHSQQLKLAKQFIDESGALRRENWGLAEMKISAGYLNRRPISEIGGLDKADPIITPVCEVGADNGAHLGYRFTIPVPREIAFVCDTTYTDENGETKKIDPNKIAKLQSYGIYVIDPPKDGQYVKPKSKDDEDWNYSYVVLPKFPDQKDPHLPFRVLAEDNSTHPDMVPKADFYGEILEKLRNQLATAQDVAEELTKVYDRWIKYWYSERRKFGESEKPKLTVFASKDSKDGKNAESSLVTNIEVWQFVMKELLRSTIGHFLCDVANGSENASKEVLTFLEAIAIIPKTASFPSFKGYKDICKQINDSKIVADVVLYKLLLNQFVDWFSDYEKWFNAASNKALRIEEFRKYISEFRNDYFLQEKSGKKESSKEEEKLNVDEFMAMAKVIANVVQDKDCDYEYKAGNKLFVNASGYDNGLKKFLYRMINGYREADVVLRKYEERIATLPNVFMENSKNVTSRGYEHGDGKLIAYERHANIDDYGKMGPMLYYESLSGTQSYIYDLMQFQRNSVSRKLSSKLYENGLVRIVIIDERVSKFLRSRPDMIKAFCRMGIWCVDETHLSPKGTDIKKTVDDGTLAEHDSLIVLSQDKVESFLNDEAEIGNSDDKIFDILIIHQGIIDKWLARTGSDSKKVENFINKLKRKISYVIITTGRGTPANIPDSARILPFSVLETTLFKKHPEKLILVDTIMNILPIGEHT